MLTNRRATKVGALAVALAACGTPDPVRDDPDAVDREHPPTLVAVLVPSHGRELLGRLLVANGPGPHPTALLLHGFPGNESNFDLAHAMRRAGWNVLTFHYRGSWGSPGAFRFGHAVEDAAAAVAWLRQAQVATRHRVDPERIALVGHSMGGFVALSVAAADADVMGVASLAGFDFGAVSERARRPDGFIQLVTSFAGGLAPLDSVDAETLVAEVRDHGSEWSLASLAPALRARPVLLVAGTRDRIAPPAVHFRPLVQAFQEHAVRLSTVVLQTGHGFSSARLALADAVIRWLDGLADTPRVQGIRLAR